MNPQGLLARIPQLRDLKIVRRLSGGDWNRSWLAARGGERLVVRWDTPAAPALGLDRKGEIRVLRSVQGCGLGPKLVFSDIRLGVLVTRWQAGRACAPDMMRNPQLLRGLGAVLRRLHESVAAPAGMAPLNLARAVDRYALIIGTVRARATARGARRILRAAAGNTRPAALCHNDPVAPNVLCGRTMSLIDWEFASPGDPLLDLAVVIGHHGLGAGRAQTLLAAARGRAHPSDRRALGHLVNCYASVRLLWEGAVRVVANRPGRRRP